MAFNHFNDNHNDFIEQLCLQKPNYSKLAALVIRANIKKSDPKEINEIVQGIEFQFVGYEAWLLVIPSAKRIFLVIKNAKTRALTFIENSIRREFSEEDLEIEFSSPMDKGINKLCDLLGKSISSNDNHSALGLKRLARSTNTFLVHSADDGIKEAITKNLQCFGNVITVGSISDFFNFYNQYAPNAVFIDGLNYSESTALFIQKIKGSLDQFCKLVVISKKSEKKYVLFILKTGVSGILIWPISFQSVLSQLHRLGIATGSTKNQKNG